MNDLYQRAIKMAQSNLQQCCAELVELSDTGVLPEGLVREISSLYATVDPGRANPLRMAESIVRDAVIRACADGTLTSWVPINEAPHDGSAVLVNDTRDEHGISSTVEATYLNGEEWSGWIYTDELLLDSNPLGPEPTHFLRAPPVPSDDS